MDKDESIQNIEEAQLSHNQDLERQRKEEENSNHVLQLIKDSNMMLLGQCVDLRKNAELLVIYAEEQLMIHRLNHYACLKKAQEKMKLIKEERNER